MRRGSLAAALIAAFSVGAAATTHDHKTSSMEEVRIRKRDGARSTGRCNAAALKRASKRMRNIRKHSRSAHRGSR